VSVALLHTIQWLLIHSIRPICVVCACVRVCARHAHTRIAMQPPQPGPHSPTALTSLLWPKCPKNAPDRYVFCVDEGQAHNDIISNDLRRRRSASSERVSDPPPPPPPFATVLCPLRGRVVQ
jgi:hypothetical protein